MVKIPPFLIRSISILWMGSIAGAAVALITQILLARSLGPSNFGEFASTFATITMLSPLAGFGAHFTVLKVYGKEGWGAERWLRPIYRYSAITSIGLSVALIAWVLVDPYSTSNRLAILIFIPIIYSQVAINLVGSKLQLEGRYGALSSWQMGVPIGRLCAVVLMIWITSNQFSVTIAASGFSLVSIIFLFVSFFSLRKIKTDKFSLKGHLSRQDLSKEPPAAGEDKPPPVGAIEVARQSMGFGLSSFLYLVYYQSSIVLLERMAGSEAAGRYNVAYILVGATYLLPAVIFQKYLLPQLHRWTNTNKKRLVEVYAKGSFFMLLLGCVGALSIYFLAPHIISPLFGNAYENSVFVVTVLAICVPLRFFSSSADAILTSGKQLSKKVNIQGCTAVLSIVMNLALIPVYGIWATVCITIFSELVMSSAMHLAAYSYLKPYMLSNKT